MVWKQDLAKLKQQFKDVGEPKPKPSVVKPVAKPDPAASIEDEDAMFLDAMGRRRVQAPSPKEAVMPPVEPVPDSAVPPPPAEDFQTAMGGLKGLKPLAPKGPAAPPKAPATPVVSPAPEAKSAVPPVLPVPPAPTPAAAEPPSQPGPSLIHLAAGMAIEADGSLDLRGHTTVDAMERLRERLQDGVFLGWRTFHITLGPSPELREAFLAFLREPEARTVARYAQAPIPMGGNQAWIVYFAAPASH
jgi:hypothetical protein